jgi:HK97 family phage portal protein
MNILFANKQIDEPAIRNYIQQILATDRPEPTSRDKTNLFATSVIAHRAGKKRADAVAAVPQIILDKAGEPLSKTDPLMIALARNYRDNMRRSELTMCFWGSNLLWKRRTYAGMIYNLRWVNPNLWSPDVRMKDGLHGFYITRGYNNSTELPSRYLNLTDAIYMHEIDFDNDFEGVAPIEVAFRHAELGVEMVETQVAFMRNRAIPASIVQPAQETKQPDETSRNQLQTMLQRVYQGAKNQGRTLIQRFRWEWIQLQMRFDEVEFATHFEQSYEAVSIAFDIPVSLIRESASNYAQQREVRLDWAQSWVVPRAEWYAEQYTDQLAQDREIVKRYGTGLVVMPDTTNVAMLKEDEKNKLERINMKVDAGIKTLYEAQVEAGEKKPDERLKDYYWWGGVPVHVSKISEMWQPPPQPVISQDTSTVPALATTTPELVTPEPEKADEPPPNGKSICIMIGLANDAELIDLQNKVKERMSAFPIKWNAPAEFHVTLVYAPAVTDQQIFQLRSALEEVTWVEEMTLPIGSLTSFDNLGEHALHFRLRRSADLEELQLALCDLCVGLGIQVSTYSRPENYKPHITMGYAEQKPPTIIFQSKIKVQPQEFQLGVGDDIVYRRAWTEEGEQPDPETPTPEPAKTFLPDDVFSELKVAARKGGAFVPNKLPPSTVTYIKSLKEMGYEQDVITAAAKSFTLSVLAARSVSATQRDFETEFDTVMEAARHDETTRRQASSKVRSLLNQFVRRAFVDGLVDGGIEDAALNDDDRQIIADLLAGQSTNVSNFLNTLFKGDGISDDQAVYKATQWWGLSVYPAYLSGLERAAADSMFEYRLGKTEKHCKSCLALDGQKHRYSEFKAANCLPKSRSLICGPGGLCDCDLVPSKGRSKGRLDTVPLAAKSMGLDEEHEHEHESELEEVEA